MTVAMTVAMHVVVVMIFFLCDQKGCRSRNGREKASVRPGHRYVPTTPRALAHRSKVCVCIYVMMMCMNICTQ